MRDVQVKAEFSSFKKFLRHNAIVEPASHTGSRRPSNASSHHQVSTRSTRRNPPTVVQKKAKMWTLYQEFVKQRQMHENLQFLIDIHVYERQYRAFMGDSMGKTTSEASLLTTGASVEDGSRLSVYPKSSHEVMASSSPVSTGKGLKRSETQDVEQRLVGIKISKSSSDNFSSRVPTEQTLKERVVAMVDLYFQSGSKLELNLSSQIMRQVRAHAKEGAFQPSIFKAAKEDVMHHLYWNSWKSFLIETTAPLISNSFNGTDK